MTARRMIVVSSAGLVKRADGYYGYAPYIREMRIWARHCGEIGFVCPVQNDGGGLLEKLDFPIHRIVPVKAFDIQSARGIWIALFHLPATLLALFKAMRWSSHIHLRCPGNISLLGCLVAILFRRKIKTAKYAGNWDPASAQPMSYRLQKFILNSPWLLTKMQVLVYGRWPGLSKNIRPSFTATYAETDIVDTPPKSLTGPVTMVFAGTLSSNKRPMFALELLREIRGLGVDARLEIFGDGSQRSQIEAHIAAHNLESHCAVHGNRPAEILREAYQRSHFTVLPSRSEGWPKAVAEGMFWGCVALATPVSCVPYMLDHGARGILLTLDARADADAIVKLIRNKQRFEQLSIAGMRWSRQFTLDLFEREIMEMTAQ